MSKNFDMEKHLKIREEKAKVLKSSFFKVKKIIQVYNDGIKREYQGVVVPKFYQYNNTFDTYEFYVYTIQGEKKEFRVNNDISIETTRIMDKKLKDKLDKFIEVSKEEHKIQLEMVKLQNEFNDKLSKLTEKTKKKREDKVKKFEDIVKVQGFIPKDKFKEEVISKIPNIPYGYSLEFDFSGSNILGISLEKVVHLGRYLTNDDYDFIWNEYDNEVMIYHEDIATSKDYAKIKRKHFKPVNISKLNKYTVKETFDANGGGDKGSASAYHIITLDFNKGIELKKENIKEVIKNINELIKHM